MMVSASSNFGKSPANALSSPSAVLILARQASKFRPVLETFRLLAIPRLSFDCDDGRLDLEQRKQKMTQLYGLFRYVVHSPRMEPSVFRVIMGHLASPDRDIAVHALSLLDAPEVMSTGMMGHLLCHAAFWEAISSAAYVDAAAASQLLRRLSTDMSLQMFLVSYGFYDQFFFSCMQILEAKQSIIIFGALVCAALTECGGSEYLRIRLRESVFAAYTKSMYASVTLAHSGSVDAEVTFMLGTIVRQLEMEIGPRQSVFPIAGRPIFPQEEHARSSRYFETTGRASMRSGLIFAAAFSYMWLIRGERRRLVWVDALALSGGPLCSFVVKKFFSTSAPSTAVMGGLVTAAGTVVAGSWLLLRHLSGRNSYMLGGTVTAVVVEGVSKWLLLTLLDIAENAYLGSKLVEKYQNRARRQNRGLSAMDETDVHVAGGAEMLVEDDDEDEDDGHDLYEEGEDDDLDALALYLDDEIDIDGDWDMDAEDENEDEDLEAMYDDDDNEV
jgi:hypothetical protein